MQEIERHYSMKYGSSYCYFPSKKQWGYVVSADERGNGAVVFLKDIRSGRMETLSLKEVPYKAPPPGWLLFKYSEVNDDKTSAVGSLLFVRMMRRTYRCGISPMNNYQIFINGPESSIRERVQSGHHLQILSALNYNRHVTNPTEHHCAISRNFSVYNWQVYWRNLVVGEVFIEARQVLIYLHEAVIQEFSDQVDLEKMAQMHGFLSKQVLIKDIREREEELL